jgi:hypothetical protein
MRFWSLAVVSASVLLASACGTDSDGGADSAGKPNSAGGSMLAYSKCMRAEGVADFPDPNAQGRIDLGSDRKFDPNSDQFKAADAKCRKLMPAGGNEPPPAANVGPAQIKYAQCMRENGVPKFPDPNAEGGIDINGDTLGVDPSGPAFKAADDKCKHILDEAAGGRPKEEKKGGGSP